ncbi:hypothetical protein NC651_028854 [Populus alba x Populus x berolinensis]|nr:hypothetical protein NC651_028854 [Populus alba x Populus x berolinensis]
MMCKKPRIMKHERRVASYSLFISSFEFVLTVTIKFISKGGL